MRRSHLLLVEDEAIIRMLLAEALREAGLGVTEAENGRDAMCLLAAPCRFDLLLTDVLMPGGVCGVALAQRFRACWPLLPVVFVTGRPDALAGFGALGPRDRCVLKPCRSSVLLTAVVSSLAI